MKRQYTWRRQIPDKRDFKFDPTLTHSARQADLIDYAPHAYDQGNEGSCTGHGTACAIYVSEHVTDYKWKEYKPSPQFIYYNARLMEGTVAIDCGATIRDAIKGVNIFGVVPEDSNVLWSEPYLTWAYAIPPTPLMYADATLHKALKYSAVAQTREAICAAIVNKLAIVIGISVYESFESTEVKQTGVVPMPGTCEQLLGGHCLCVVGYDLDKDWAIVQNSWGKDWGIQGRCYIPFEYLCDPDLAGDFWVIEKIGVK